MIGGVRVLLVDDEPDIQRLGSLNLESSGHGVLCESDGLAGLDRAVAERPDVIVLDVMMGRNDGLTMLRSLRKMPETEDIPVVLLTARVQRRDELEGWLAGADAYVKKPFSPGDLVAAVESVASAGREGCQEERVRRIAELLEPVCAQAVPQTFGHLRGSDEG
jgi:DNA-binding response OmpR family regulator